MAAVHTGDAGLNPTWSKFFLFNNVHYNSKVTNTELQNINWLMDYRDAHWYNY